MPYNSVKHLPKLEKLQKKQKKEVYELLEKISDIEDLKRTADSIVKTDSFHLDANFMKDGNYANYYKVDIQFVSGQGKKSYKTVSVVFVHKDAKNLHDYTAAVTESLEDQYEYKVT